MFVIIGSIIVMGAVVGGFLMAGGHVGALWQLSEMIVICGSAFGAMVIMAPKSVLISMFKMCLGCIKGSPYTKAAYEELLKLLYELFMLGRRNGMIALEEHVMKPESSNIFSKYPSFLRNHHAVEFLCGGLKPIIDGKIKPDQLQSLMDAEIHKATEEDHVPIVVLTKTADAMPGFGIVAAVLGIIITMASIGGPPEEIGHHVAAALVGTFLGILVSYGFLGPLATNMEINCEAEHGYTKCIALSVVSFANGMAPIMAVEVARRGLGHDVKPSAEELEAMMKTLNTAPKG
ncbi:MAG: flagellar motor stator protein MotA [Verrucomicrobia bacterium]|nr:flagellar motor stator protein MotA [Verrucomicrobiota bacterium]MBI3871075.1 flagellar motor stator protein MotA [Verrucomicrobiota bacterium]